MKLNPIGWCHVTINFWWGCTEVSRACKHCYARDFAKYVSKSLFGTLVEWGKGKPRVERLEAARAEAIALNKQAAKKGIRYRVFANSMSDWLDEEVPIAWLACLLETIRITPHLDWQLLTKRPENWGTRIEAGLQAIEASPDWNSLPNDDPQVALRNWLADWFVLQHRLPNVLIGTTIEDRAHLTRLDAILKIPAAFRFLSMEPLMEQVSLPNEFIQAARKLGSSPIHQVIVGGESGNYKDEPGKAPTLRPMNPQWVRVLRNQCQSAGIAFYFKQWGEWVPVDQQDPAVTMPNKMRGWRDPASTQLYLKAGTKKAGHLIDGKAHQEFPITSPAL